MPESKTPPPSDTPKEPSPIAPAKTRKQDITLTELFQSVPDVPFQHHGNTRSLSFEDILHSAGLPPAQFTVMKAIEYFEEVSDFEPIPVGDDVPGFFATPGRAIGRFKNRWGRPIITTLQMSFTEYVSDFDGQTNEYRRLGLQALIMAELLPREFGLCEFLILAVRYNWGLTPEGIQAAKSAGLLEGEVETPTKQERESVAVATPNKTLAQETTKQKRSGRKVDIHRQTRDMRIYKSRKSGTGYEGIATELRMSIKEVKDAYDRARQRAKRTTK